VRGLAFVGLALAAVLRLGWLDRVVFQIDEAAPLRAAEDLVRLGRFPVEGPLSSQGLPLAPHFSYLMAPVVAVGRDPMWPTAAVAAANLAAVAGVLWLAWRSFGPFAGTIATLLFAVNPSAVFYARKVWQPNLHAPLAVLLFAALELGVLQRRAWWAAVTFPIVLLGAGVHYAFLVLAPLLLAPAVVLVRDRRWLPLATGLLLALLITVPVDVHLVRTNFEDYRNLRYRGSFPAAVDLDGLGYTLGVSTGWATPLVAEVVPLDHGLPEPVGQAATLLETALLGGALVVALGWALQRGTPPAERSRLAAVVVWLLLPAALTTRHSMLLQSHYYLLTIPAVFLLIGLGAEWLRRQVAALGWAVLAVVLPLAAVQTVGVLELFDRLATTYEPCFDVPLGATRDRASSLAAFATSGSSQRLAIENYEVDAEPLAYLLRPAFVALDLATIGNVGLASMPAPTAVGGRVLNAAQPLDLHFPFGVRLVAASFFDEPEPGWRLRLGLLWQGDIDAASPRAAVAWRAGLLDGGGQPVVDEDRRPLSLNGIDHSPEALRGQRIVSWFTFQLPRTSGADGYRAALRLIDTNTLEPLPFTASSAEGGTVWQSPPVQAAPSPRCRP
jgi:hypothetical protein